MRLCCLYIFPILLFAVTGCQKLSNLHRSNSGTPEEGLRQIQPHIADAGAPNLALLNEQGVLSSVKGDELLLILPSDRFFVGSTDRLNPTTLSTLDAVCKLLRKFDDAPIVITGHTDSIGSDDYKHVLSIRRARRIASYFWGLGIDYRRIATKGYGDIEPITKPSIAGDGLNRRIEIRVRRTVSGANPLELLSQS